MTNPEGFLFSVGEHVSKYTGDYDFDGVVISVFKKLSGQHRYDVENEHGSVHIFSASQLRPMKPHEIEAWEIKRAAHDAKKNLHSSS